MRRFACRTRICFRRRSRGCLCQGQAGDLLDNAIKQNVILNIERLQTATPILSDAVQGGKLTVAGGIYSLDTGRVMLIA
jgi:carbonic anhydrase